MRSILIPVYIASLSLVSIISIRHISTQLTNGSNNLYNYNDYPIYIQLRSNKLNIQNVNSSAQDDPNKPNESWWWQSISEAEMESNPHGVWKVRFPPNETTANPIASTSFAISQSQQQQSWKLADYAFLASIHDATLVTPDGLVCNATQAYTFGKWYWEKDADKCVTTSTTTAVTLESSSTELEVALPATSTDTTQHHLMSQQEYVSLVAIYDDYFQHIPFDTLPKMIMVCPFLHHKPTVHVLVMNHLQRDLVREICPGIHTDRFLVVPSGRANRNERGDVSLPLPASTIYIPHFAKDDGSQLSMGLTCRHCLSSLGPQDVQDRGTDILYISRGNNKVRGVSNEDAVIQVLLEVFPKNIHVHVFHPTNDWRVDRNTLSKARVIITPHGGALANMIFAPAHYTKIVEFIPLSRLKAMGKNERPCYFGLSQALGFDYYEVEPSNFDFEHGSMTIPLDGLRGVVQKVRDQIVLEEKQGEELGLGVRLHLEDESTADIGISTRRDSER